ncbi:MAG TPA: DnaA regulatory inactivator Hda [Burkholderiaceae bacterium]|nr:DnaA regulatory inactivator Hda [Burkholderiaceae bacterium]
MSQQLILDVFPAPAPSLDNFIVGANGPALEALRNCTPGRAVFLWGTSGSGRSHLLQAITQKPGGLYIAAHNAASQLQQVLKHPPNLQAIALDDIHKYNDDGQIALFRLYNQWRELADTPLAFALFLAADRSPLALPMREDLRSRLGWDLVFRLEQLSDEQRAQALQTSASEQGMQLGDDVVNWLLTHYTRNMSVLGSLITALNRYALEKQRAITLPLLKDLLAQARTKNTETP